MFTAFLESFSEGTRDPEEGMNAEEGKGADQQSGHGPEGIIQVWILIPIMMGRMGQVTSELPVGTGVAFLAGINHIAPV